MTLSTTLSRPFGIAALTAFSVVLLSTPTTASAKSRLHHERSAQAHHHRHYGSHHVGRRYARRHVRHVTAGGQPQQMAAYTGFGGSNVVDEARRYIGGNPTGRGRLWCARFMNMVLERSGHQGSGSDMARSFASYGQRLAGPQVGAIAVMSRGRRGGHVGVVSGIDSTGNPIVISGNHGHRVAEAVYSANRIYAYVMPN